MEKKVWLGKEINLLEMLEDEKYELLMKYAKDNQQHLMSKWFVSDTSSFQKIVRFGMSILRYFEKHLEENSKEKAVFRLGTLMGTVESFEYLLYEKKQDNFAEKAFNREVLSIKHLDEIILALEVHGIMSHSEICECLNLKESTLSEVMKKVDLTNLISSSRSGKYKLYRLTDEGRRLGKQLRRQNYENAGEKEVLLQLQRVLENAKYKEDFKQKVRTVLEDVNKEYAATVINPGDLLAIYSKGRDKKEPDKYRVYAVLNDRNAKDNTVKIMAEKKKVEFDYEKISNIKKEKEKYA